jgi:hypothetical protein
MNSSVTTVWKNFYFGMYLVWEGSNCGHRRNFDTHILTLLVGNLGLHMTTGSSARCQVRRGFTEVDWQNSAGFLPRLGPGTKLQAGACIAIGDYGQDDMALSVTIGFGSRLVPFSG